MRIKFKKPDPRAGTVAQMDSSRGQQLIDSGAAVQVGEDDAEQAVEQTTEGVPSNETAAVLENTKPAKAAKGKK